MTTSSTRRAAAAALLSLTLLLSACGGGGSADGSSPTAAGSPDRDATSTPASDDAQTSPASEGTEHSGADLAATDSRWLDLASTVAQRTQSPGGDLTIDQSQPVYVEGDVATLTVAEGACGVMAENVETLVVEGSNLSVFVQDVKEVRITGDHVMVTWAGTTPVVTASGTDNYAVHLTELSQGLYWTC